MREYIVSVYDDRPNHDEIFVGYVRDYGQELVRCAHCTYWDSKHSTVGFRGHCDRLMRDTYMSFYCGYGERRTDNEVNT